ncbi:gene transfer agent family protein [Rhodobacteraceae bacterium R_SAG8]|nr:gene transfer agent family protein [Rhodobacteraceae bacterium R_SAG8]
MITHRAFFGTADHSFTLTDNMVTELERVTDTGIGAFYQRMIAMHFKATDLAEIIRLGLIGAGMHPQEAMQLVNTYARNRPMAETFPLALDILDARWNGTTPATGEATE